jgi:hypothetical protein
LERLAERAKQPWGVSHCGGLENRRQNRHGNGHFLFRQEQPDDGRRNHRTGRNRHAAHGCNQSWHLGVRRRSSRLLKNCVGQYFLSSFAAFSNVERFCLLCFSRSWRPPVGIQRHAETLRPGLTVPEPRRPSGFAYAPGCRPRTRRQRSNLLSAFRDAAPCVRVQSSSASQSILRCASFSSG